METTFSSSTATAANKRTIHAKTFVTLFLIPIIDVHENKKKGHVLSLSILYFYIFLIHL
jgi:hypothetical protein